MAEPPLLSKAWWLEPVVSVVLPVMLEAPTPEAPWSLSTPRTYVPPEPVLPQAVTPAVTVPMVQPAV